MKHFPKERLFITLKQILKRKNISYKKLCESLSFSESTLKNIFFANNCNIERILEICEAIDISFPDLVTLSNQNDQSEFSFSFENEEFFANNPNFFYFFRECFFEKKDPKQIKQEFNLTDVSVTKYLSTLEKMNLLEVFPDNKIRFKCYGRLCWQENGPWMKKFFPIYTQELLNLYCQNNTDKRFYTSNIGYFSVSNEVFEDFKAEIQAVEKKYKDRAFQDFLINTKEKNVPVSWNFTIIPFDIFKFETVIQNI